MARAEMTAGGRFGAHAIQLVRNLRLRAASAGAALVGGIGYAVVVRRVGPNRAIQVRKIIIRATVGMATTRQLRSHRALAIGSTSALLAGAATGSETLCDEALSHAGPVKASGEVNWRQLVVVDTEPAMLDVSAELARVPALVRSECRISPRNRSIFSAGCTAHS